MGSKDGWRLAGENRQRMGRLGFFKNKHTKMLNKTLQIRGFLMSYENHHVLNIVHRAANSQHPEPHVHIPLNLKILNLTAKFRTV